MCFVLYIGWPRVVNAWWFTRDKVETVEATTTVAVVEKVETRTFDSEVHRLAVKYNQNEALALKIMQCEGQHYKDAVNKNYHREYTGEFDENGVEKYILVHWSSDWGHWQINDYYHLDSAKRMGLDIKDEWGNLEYGFWLLSVQGTSPWNASKYCWKSVSGVDT